MRKFAFAILLWLFACQPALAANPQIEFQTSAGSFVVELYPDKAPRTVENFLRYVNSGFYEGTIFHRVINKFIIQGGGLTPDLQAKSTYSPVPNEANNGLRNEPGTLAMARAFNPDSATSQFYINLDDNKMLNYFRPEPALMGYTVFGKIIRGMEIAQKIAIAPTQTVGRLSDVPLEPVVIQKAALLETPIMAEETHKIGESDSPPAKSSKKGKKRG
jgi:peptidyl-prolyl cis-trans isomerase A (cyclophilin A)